MTSQRFMELCLQCLEIMRERAPYDTGNLSRNAVKIEFPNADTCRIYVDEDIAPYMVFTNETWNPENHYGHQNPNLHWFDKAAREIVRFMASQTKGEVKRK